MLFLYLFIICMFVCGDCKICQAGYYNINGEGECRVCPEKCKSCTSNDTCTECKTGYYGSYCQYNCTSECTGDRGCNINNGLCSLCAPNCISCTSESNCTVCKNGYYNGYVDNVYISNCSLKCRLKCISCQSFSVCVSCAKGYYGMSCSNECSAGCNDSVCKGDGTCDCKSGVIGSKCDKCLEENCSNVCPTSCRSCDTPNTCTACNDGFYGIDVLDPTWPYWPHHYIYDCRFTCQYKGCKTCSTYETCSECNTRFFGPNCEFDCPSGCNDSFECNKETGACEHGCKLGIWGDKCEKICLQDCLECNQNNGSCVKCEDGKFTNDCTSNCNANCNTTDGKPVCDINDGFCTHGCISNTIYGPSCEKYCSINCRNKECDRSTGTCAHGCEKNYYGQSCDYTCSEKCISASDHISVSKCHETNGTCLYGCDNGWYGNTCRQRCSFYCVNLACDHIDGSCIAGCVHGYSGKDCQQKTLVCERNNYGPNCDYICSERCLSASNLKIDRICHETNGNCLHGCDNGWYGSACSQKCSVFCVNLACNVIDGSCSAGCTIGYSGKRCQQVSNEDPNKPLTDALTTVGTYAGAGVALGMLVILVTALVVLMCIRNRKLHRKANKSQVLQDIPIQDLDKDNRYERSGVTVNDERDNHDNDDHSPCDKQEVTVNRVIDEGYT